MKVVKIFFQEPDDYIHGTDDEEILGFPASNGCIRLASAGAYALAKLLMQNGGAPQTNDWYDSVISGKRSVEVKLPKPVPITIGP